MMEPDPEEKLFPEFPMNMKWGEIFKHVRKKGTRTDFVFIVGKTRTPFPVHRKLLEIRGEAFCKIIDESRDGKFYLENTNPVIFDRFLNFVYSEELPPSEGPIEECIELLRLAVDFDMKPLKEKCLEILLSRLGFDTFDKIRLCSNRHEIIGLETAVLNFMIQNSNEFISSDHFVRLKMTDLREFLKSDDLECTELSLFNAVLRWGISRSQPWKGVYPVLSETLQPLIKSIRFPLMTSQVIAEHVAPKGLLSQDQLLEIYNYICAGPNSKPQTKIFSSTPRRSENILTQGTTATKTEQSIPSSSSTSVKFSTVSSQTTSTILRQYEDDGTQTDITQPKSTVISVSSQTTNSPQSKDNETQTDTLSPATNLSEDARLPCHPLNQPHRSPSPSATTPSTGDGRNNVQVNGGSDILESPIIEAGNTRGGQVEFLIPASVGETSAGGPAQTPHNLKKRRREIFVSPPSSTISSVCTPSVARIRTTKQRPLPSSNNPEEEAHNSGEDSESESDIILCAHRDDGMQLDTWEKLVNRWKKAVAKSAEIGVIQLRNCQIQRHYPEIFMPLIQEFLVDLVFPFETPEEFSRFMDVFDLRRYIFFSKAKGQPWGFDQLWEMNVKLELVINDVKFFKMDHQDREVTISFRNDTTELLGALVDVDSRDFEKLNLASTDLPPTRFTTSALKEVVLYKVFDYFNSELGDVLRQLRNLESLSCWMERQKWDSATQNGIQDKSPINLAKDLSSKNKLRRLAVSNAKLTLNSVSGVFSIERFKKENLVELYTNMVHWSVVIIDSFDLLFPNLKRVSFRKCKFEDSYDCYSDYDDKEQLFSAVTIKLLVNVLEIQSIEWIRVWGMDWKHCTNSTYDPLTLSEDTRKLKAFLKRAGLKLPFQNFVLRKNLITGAWEGDQFDGQESQARDVENGYWDQMKELEFGYFELNKIYKDYKTFKLYSDKDPDEQR